jgi:hypothetical protein
VFVIAVGMRVRECVCKSSMTVAECLLLIIFFLGIFWHRNLCFGSV